MEIRSTMLPGQKGTRRLQRKYGDQLVCVRYRYDKQRAKRYTTVELIVDENDWSPGIRFPFSATVLLRIDYGETDLRELVKQHGGFWVPEKRGWQLPLHQVRLLGLEKRIIDELGL